MFDYLYEWGELKPDSPDEATRNEWLYLYGAFGKFNGMWFPVTVVFRSMLGNPSVVLPIPIPDSLAIPNYPQGNIAVGNMDVLYSVFGNGLSLQSYVWSSLERKRQTDIMLDAAINRSLNTEIVTAKRNLMQSLKRALTRGSKREPYIVDAAVSDDIKVIALPNTSDILEKLWNSNDWAIQEISQLLGISYNPAHGKKERMLQNELLGDRDITLMMRRKVTSRLRETADKFGEEVTHISTLIDTIDRDLNFEKEGDTFADGKSDHNG